MSDVDPLPVTSPFESGILPIEVIIVWIHGEGWRAGTVLYRAGTGPVHAQAPWQEPFLDSPPRPLTELWEYLATRVRLGRGGNYYTYELEGFEVEDPGHIVPLVTARAAQVAAATYGPLGYAESGPGDDSAGCAPQRDAPHVMGSSSIRRAWCFIVWPHEY